MNKISGEVIHGKALARTIGFPTANIDLKNGIVEEGTYKVNIIYNNNVYLGAGAYREKEELFEAHLFNFDQEIYGETVEVYILEKIRDNKKIHSLDELKEMINDDIKYIKSHIFYGITFGTFDKFHPGHKYYLSEARKYCEKLITIVSHDINVQKIKSHTSRDNQSIRKISVQESNISHEVFIGEKDDHLKYIRKYSPQVIILGYDQEGYLGELQEYINTYHMNTEIIRLDSYKPEIYKSSKM